MDRDHILLRLIAVVRDRVSGALFRLISTDWKEAAFWRETIVGGIVRAQTGEGLAPMRGGGCYWRRAHSMLGGTRKCDADRSQPKQPARNG